MGCIMMRCCQDDSCPVGIATQNPELRKNFKGKPEHVENFMRFLAQGVREYMAKLGIRTLNELVGRSDLLATSRTIKHWKAKGVDLSKILHQVDTGDNDTPYCTITQDHGIEESLDMRVLMAICEPAIKRGEKVSTTLPIKNTNRAAGTIVGHEVTKAYGSKGLPDDTIHLKFIGSAGQSLGAFIPKGMTIELVGDANDYIGKGLSGGRIIAYPPKSSKFVPEENIIVGNVAFYGATSGEAFIRGMAGERFCVRNSGMEAVVESVGDHGCEYMTGGKVVILGKTGRNFAAACRVAWPTFTTSMAPSPDAATSKWSASRRSKPRTNSSGSARKSSSMWRLPAANSARACWRRGRTPRSASSRCCRTTTNALSMR